MTDLNTRLQQVFVRRAAERSRLENGTLVTLAPYRASVTDALVQILQQYSYLFGDKPAFGIVRNGASFQSMLDQMAGTIAFLVQQYVTTTGSDLKALAELELRELPLLVAQQMDQAMQEAPGDPPLPVSGFLTSEISALLSSPLGGARYGNAFADLSTATMTQLRNTLTTAIVQGWSVAQAARSVRGILGSESWQAERIVRSEFTRVANQATMVFYDQNRALFRGVQWVSTLDRRTCIQCGLLDGRTWAQIEDAPLPVNNTHPSCRCTLVPLVKSAKDLNLAPSYQTTFSNATPNTIKYRDWFKQQEPAFQREVLGATRYKLYRQGKFKLTDFASLRGVRSVQSLVQAARSR